MSTGLETKEQLFDVMEQIAAEREAARPIVERLVTGGEPVDDIEIPEGWRTAGFVQELSETAGNICETNPLRSLPLQHLALVLAMRIPESSYPPPISARLKGNAWKEIAWVHLYQNAYEACLRACNAAQRVFAEENTLLHDQARVALTRSYAFTFVRRDEEALRTIQECAEIFCSFGDEDRISITKQAKALVHQNRGELDFACSQYEELLRRYEKTDKIHILAWLYNNLGEAYALLGRLSDAVVALQRARELHAELGLTTDKPDWGLAHVLLAKGEFERAVNLLERLRVNFLARRMPEDAGLVGLDVVEALIATDKMKEARSLTEQIITEFRNADLNERAIEALAYLRDLLPRTETPRKAVQHVRSYVDRLRSEPALLFLPLED
ncbi:MAG TPA: tetratricopeptide repeat protein [Gemmatimonadaceae bacterium]